MISFTEALNCVSRGGVRKLTDAFDTSVRIDPERAAIFVRRSVTGGLAKMYACWSSVLLSRGRYNGNPIIMRLDTRHPATSV